MKNRTIENLHIEDIEWKGKGIGRHNGKVIFVENTLPGEVVDVQITRKKRDYAQGVPTVYHQTAKERIDPFCQHFADCGGCTWQNIPYEKQLEFKTYFVKTAFERIGKFEHPTPEDIIGCAKTEFYRNKMEFSFSDRMWLTQVQIDSGATFETRKALGFHKPSFFDKIIDIEKCYLQADPSNEIRLAVKKFAIQNEYTFHNTREKSGLLRSLFIRTTSLGELLLLFMFGENDRKNITPLLDFVNEKFKITSLNYLINTSGNDSITDQEVVNYAGAPHIIEAFGNIKLQVGPKSFSQTNSDQATVLYNEVARLAALTGKEIVYDIYCGIGSISLFIANQCKRVIGIEQVEEAIVNANDNAKLNNITNCEFYAGDARKLLNDEFIAEHGSPDLVIIDPPRAGLHPKVVKTLLESGVPKIIYVSCNPVTQARDLAGLVEKYKITKVQPIDMFPHTYHVENIVVLSQ